MTLADITKRIKAHYQASKHMCVIVLDGNRVILKNKRTGIIHKWDDSLEYMEIENKYIKQVKQQLNELQGIFRDEKKAFH